MNLYKNLFLALGLLVLFPSCEYLKDKKDDAKVQMNMPGDPPEPVVAPVAPADLPVDEPDLQPLLSGRGS